MLENSEGDNMSVYRGLTSLADNIYHLYGSCHDWPTDTRVAFCLIVKNLSIERVEEGGYIRYLLKDGSALTFTIDNWLIRPGD